MRPKACTVYYTNVYVYIDIDVYTQVGNDNLILATKKRTNASNLSREMSPSP